MNSTGIRGATSAAYANPREARDPRRSFMLNGEQYRRNLNRKPEPHTTFRDSLVAGIVIALFTLGILALAVGVS